ncbi:hypothetical protein [Pelagibius marinus]|uniref:hypothetical protein n=1 Tax=Pelagibius marinus TaxID=2762760 RepID=UPI0018732DA7|nr:hypothetical protein [Pelagibius marinus]
MECCFPSHGLVLRCFRLCSGLPQSLNALVQQTVWLLWIMPVGTKVNPESGSRSESSALAHEAASRNSGVALAVKAFVKRQLQNGSLVAPFDETCDSGEGCFLT